ncbi:hypothetical protein Tco_1020248 [Tanacetum coccineum]|uniref:Uncharacterized protein n=1 Tax=Tanacetum coccineum TaxID=301880 RepID=A0ABQ5G0Y5_9ASTR
MQLLAAMLPQDQEGEGAGVAAQAVPPPIPELIPEPMPTPDQPQDHLSTPPRQQTPPASPPSPPRSTQAPPVGHTSGGAEDLITLTILSYVVSTFVHKVNSLETELKAHKKLFKDVVGKLVKKVKAMEVKLKTKKRKVVVSDSDQKEGGEQAVDLDALIALANAAVTIDSNNPPGGASNNPAASSHIPTDVPTAVNSFSNERLSEIEATRLEALERERFEKEKAEIARHDAIYAKHIFNADWIDIMAQVHANAGLSSKLLGADVNDDNFAKRMVALINQRKRAFAEQTAKEKRDKPMTHANKGKYMRTTLRRSGCCGNLKSSKLRRTLKEAGKALEPEHFKEAKVY